MRVGDDARRDADHHVGGLPERVELVDVVEVVDDDPRTGLHGGLQLLRGFRVAVQQDPVAVEARVERQRELAPGRDVDAQALLSNTRSTAVHGNALEAKITSPSPMAVLNSRARPRRSSSATA